MTKRSLHQLQQSLLEQFNKFSRRGDQPGPEMGGGSVGLGSVTTSRIPSNVRGPKVWRQGDRPSADIPTALKPKVSVEKGRELGIVKPEPKVWRTPDGKSSSKPPARTVSKPQAPLSAERSSRPAIPGLSTKEKRSAVKKSAAVHGAAAIATGLSLTAQDQAKEPSIPPPEAGTVWVDTADFVPADSANNKPVTANEPPVKNPDIPLQAASIKSPPPRPAAPTVLPTAPSDAVSQPIAKSIEPSAPISEPSVTPAVIPTPGSVANAGTNVKPGTNTDSKYEYKPGYTGLPFKEQTLKEKYAEFLNEDDAKEKFLQRVIGPESGGKPGIKNPFSTATGLFQFIEPTWKSIVAKAAPGDPHYGVSFKEMPQNVPAQRAAARQIADEYAQTIRRAKLPDTPTSYYLLHGHGPKAVEIYKNPDKQLKDIYPEYVQNKKGEMVKNIVYRQNPNFNPNQRLSDFVATRARQIGDKLSDVFPGAMAGELPKQSANISAPIKAVKNSNATPKEPAEQKPIGALVQPDYSKYNVGDLGTLEKIGPGRWRSIKGQLVTNAPELENLPVATAPETFLNKLKRAAPTFLGGSGELTSQVFGDKKKSVAVPTVAAKSVEPTAAVPKAPVAPAKAAQLPDTKSNIQLQRDQVGLVQAKKELSDFEQAFAAARTEKGPGSTFTWANPKTGKTATYTTLYRGEQPPVKIEPAVPVKSDTVVPASLDIKKVSREFDRKQDLDRIIKQAQEPTSVPAPRTADELASDELWKDARSEWDALPTDTQQQRVRDAKLSQAGFDDLTHSPELKESINTASHAELHYILRLAGRTK